MLDNHELSPLQVMNNGVYDFGQSISVGYLYAGYTSVSEETRALFAGPIPAAQAASYNEYFDTYDVDLLMGPASVCDKVTWSEDIGGAIDPSLGCDGGRFSSGCASACHVSGAHTRIVCARAHARARTHALKTGRTH
eukprot:2980657-Pleurochrysis_carterae.AAC.4